MHCGLANLLCQTLRPTEKQFGIYMGSVKQSKLVLLSRPAVAEMQRWSVRGELAGWAWLQWSSEWRRPRHHLEKLLK